MWFLYFILQIKTVNQITIDDGLYFWCHTNYSMMILSPFYDFFIPLE